MSLWKRSFLTAAIAVLLTLGAHYTARSSHLKELARLQAANDRMRFGISQQVMKRTDAARAAESVRAAPSRQIVDGQNTGDAPGTSIDVRREPTGDYRNEGRLTPVAASQTFAWACDRGDAAAMEQLIVFDAAARTKAAGHLASLPANVGTPWASPEAMAAALLISDGINHPFPLAGILAQAKTEQLSDARVVLHLPDTRREYSEYQKTPDGWKYVITEAMVDDYLARAAQAVDSQ